MQLKYEPVKILVNKYRCNYKKHVVFLVFQLFSDQPVYLVQNLSPLNPSAKLLEMEQVLISKLLEFTNSSGLTNIKPPKTNKDEIKEIMAIFKGI